MPELIIDHPLRGQHFVELFQILVRPGDVPLEPRTSLVNADRSLENLHDRRIDARTALLTESRQPLGNLIG